MPPAAEQATFNENVTTPLTNTIDNFLEGGGQAATDFRNELLAKGLINEDGT